MTLATDTPTSFEHQLGATGTVDLETLDTEIRLRGVAGSTVRVRLARGDLASEFRIEASDGRLELRPTRRWVFGRRRDIGPLDVDVPASAHVLADSASGSILAIDLTGGIEVHSAAGHVDLAGVEGTVRAQTISGGIRIRAGGPATMALRSVSGAVDAIGSATRSLAARSISGAVQVAGRFEGEGPFAIETVSGEVTIRTEGSIQLRASTVSGEVRTDSGSFGRGGSRRTLSVGGSGPLVDARTVSGGIRVVAWRSEPGRGADDRSPVDVPTASTAPGAPPPPAAPPSAASPAAAGPEMTFGSDAIVGEARPWAGATVPTGSVGPAAPDLLEALPASAPDATAAMAATPPPDAAAAAGTPAAPDASAADTPAAPDAVAEATSRSDPEAPDGAAAADAIGEDPRLPILRALQRGEIDVAEADRRLDALEPDDA